MLGPVAATVVGCVGTAWAGGGLPVVHEAQRLVPDGAAHRARFGCSVAWWGDDVVVGAYKDDGSGELVGSVYLFGAADWSQAGRLSPDGLSWNARFGNQVAMDRDTLVVSAPRDEGVGRGSGTVFLYDREGRTIRKELRAADFSAGDTFGVAPVLYGDRLLVGGALYVDDFAPVGSVFVFDANTGAKIGNIFPDSDDRFIGFGNDIDVHGSTVVVGAPYDETHDWESGAAFLFDLESGEQVTRIEPPTPQRHDYFGSRVGVSEDFVFIASERGWTGHGAVEVFDPRDGSHAVRIMPPEGVEVREFGLGFDISGRYALVFGTEVGGVSEDHFESGVYLYDLLDFRPIARLTPSDTDGDRELWASPIGFRGTQALVGSSTEGHAGALYVFEMAGLMCMADRAKPFGRLDIFDVASFLRSFGAGESEADFAEPYGVLDVRDVQAFLGAFGAGCSGG